jgi:hypothetical protein
MEFSQLIQQPESLRDDRWESDFLTQFSQLKVQLDGEEARQGPDGWPYLFARTAPEAQEPVKDVMQWLAGRGIGLVVNAHKMLPDYIFPYGMVWNFVETGQFLLPETTARAGDVVYSKDKNLIMGAPSEKYLPPYVRTVLKDFLATQGFTAPRVLVISTPDFQEVDLLVSVDSLLGLPQSQHKALAEMIAWFLPLHYTLVLGPEQNLPPFHPL